MRIDAAPLDHHRRRARRHVWRRIRAGADLRPDHRRQNGALLLSGAAAGADSRLRRHSAAEARSGQRGRARSAAHRPQHQRDEGAGGGTGQPGDGAKAKRCAWRARRPRRCSKFDRETAVAAKRFIKPIPHEELRREIEIFCDCSRGLRWRPACASSSRAPTRCRICRRRTVRMLADRMRREIWQDTRL